jgi:hypothetical protein
MSVNIFVSKILALAYRMAYCPSSAVAPRTNEAPSQSRAGHGSRLTAWIKQFTLIRGCHMAQTQIANVIVPAEFTAYQVENSLVTPK